MYVMYRNYKATINGSNPLQNFAPAQHEYHDINFFRFFFCNDLHYEFYQSNAEVVVV